jgi:hypothetical protein
MAGFPIMGYGFGQLLLDLGGIPTPRSAFPFWIFQLLIGVSALLMLLRYQWQQPRLSNCIIGYSIFMLILFFFSRFFHDIYIVFGATLVAIGYLIDEPASAPEQTTHYARQVLHCTNPSPAPGHGYDPTRGK